MQRGHPDGESERQSPLRGFSQILAGTAVGQVLTFIAMPFLSRIYPPEQFGVLSFALTIVTVVMPIALLGFDQAVLLPRNDSSVMPIVAAAFTCLTFVGGLLVCVILWSPLPNTIDPLARPFLAWSVPLLLLVTGTVAVLTQLAVRGGRYGSIGSRNTAQSIAITASHFAFSSTAKSGGFSGLVTGNLIGTSMGVFLLAPYGKRYARPFTAKEAVQAVRRYWRFPLVFAPMTSLTLLAQQTPVLFVIYWFGVADGGQLGMAERIVAVPLALVGMAVSSVFTGEISQAHRTGASHMVRIYLRTSLWLGVAGSVVALGLVLLAPILLPVFLGSHWQLASHIAQVMAIVAATRMLANPVHNVFRVFERARFLVAIELARAALLGVAVLLSMSNNLDLLTSLILLFAALSVADVITWVSGLLVVREADRAALRSNADTLS